MSDPCSECAQGKCANCDGAAWDDDLDDLTVCPCAAASHQLGDLEVRDA